MATDPPKSRNNFLLRDVTESDLHILFEHQLDSTANHMAAFTAKNPADRDAIMAHWTKIIGDRDIFKKTIVFEGNVVGSIARYIEQEFAKPEVTYWIGKEYWGKGLATRALSQFLALLPERPIYARVAHDNIASIRVLEKNGFKKIGRDRGFANARSEEIEEVILKLEASKSDALE